MEIFRELHVHFVGPTADPMRSRDGHDGGHDNSSSS